MTTAMLAGNHQTVTDRPHSLDAAVLVNIHPITGHVLHGGTRPSTRFSTYCASLSDTSRSTMAGSNGWRLPNCLVVVLCVVSENWAPSAVEVFFFFVFCYFFFLQTLACNPVCVLSVKKKENGKKASAFLRVCGQQRKCLSMGTRPWSGLRFFFFFLVFFWFFLVFFFWFFLVFFGFFFFVNANICDRSL